MKGAAGISISTAWLGTMSGAQHEGSLANPQFLFAGRLDGRLLIAAAEPPPHMNNDCNCSQDEYEMYQRHHRYCGRTRSEEHTSELQSLAYLVCRLLLEKKKL